MNITLAPQATPTDRQPMSVIVDGKIIGKVEPVEYSTGTKSWHASINLSGIGLVGFIQGHGDTEEEAIGDAIASARREAAERRRLVDEFAGKIGYQEPG